MKQLLPEHQFKEYWDDERIELHKPSDFKRFPVSGGIGSDLVDDPYEGLVTSIDLHEATERLTLVPDPRFHAIIQGLFGADDDRRSQAQLAEDLGLSPKTLRLFEKRALQYLGSFLSEEIPRPNMYTRAYPRPKPEPPELLPPPKVLAQAERLKMREEQTKKEIEHVPYRHWNTLNVEDLEARQPFTKYIFGNMHTQEDLSDFVDHLSEQLTPHFANGWSLIKYFEELKDLLGNQIDFDNLRDIHLYDPSFRPSEPDIRLDAWFSTFIVATQHDGSSRVLFVKLQRGTRFEEFSGFGWRSSFVRSAESDQVRLPMFLSKQEKYISRIERHAWELNKIKDKKKNL